MRLWLLAASLAVFVTAFAQQHQIASRGELQRHSHFVRHLHTFLDVAAIAIHKVSDALSCVFKCLENARCISYNLAIFPDADDKYDCQLLATDKFNSSNKLMPSKNFSHYTIETPCESSPCQNGGTCRPVYEKSEYKCECAPGFVGTHCQEAQLTGRSCGDILKAGVKRDGEYGLLAEQQNFTVFCDMTHDNKAWTLIARFSNKDSKNWMKNSGEYWYDRKSAVGQTTNPADNTDMISPAFWSVNGTEFKITRNDDSNHTALLHTTGECLGGQTFRSKMTSYGHFRNSKVWASDKCLGNCDVEYGGQYKTTEGFGGANCSGDMQQKNKIGFWCDYRGNGAVMTIGGAGGSGPCVWAGHGIGITAANEASFAHDQHQGLNSQENEYDFGKHPSRNVFVMSPYSLNLWVC